MTPMHDETSRTRPAHRARETMTAAQLALPPRKDAPVSRDLIGAVCARRPDSGCSWVHMCCNLQGHMHLQILRGKLGYLRRKHRRNDQHMCIYICCKNPNATVMITTGTCLPDRRIRAKCLGVCTRKHSELRACALHV